MEVRTPLYTIILMIFPIFGQEMVTCTGSNFDKDLAGFRMWILTVDIDKGLEQVVDHNARIIFGMNLNFITYCRPLGLYAGDGDSNFNGGLIDFWS